jgi:predicted amidohydrolase
MVVKSEDFRYFNAAVYLSGGEVKHVHRKVYLPTYGMFDEQRYFAPGDRIRAFDLAGVRAGMLVCEDMWHLSTVYLLFLQGVSMLLCISSSPGRGVLANADADAAPGSVGSWEDLLRTVAEYTTCYVAYVNRLGYEDGVNFWGGSCVFGPDGQPVARAEEKAGLVLAEIDMREVERQRLAVPLLRDEKAEFTLRELERIWNERTDTPY